MPSSPTPQIASIALKNSATPAAPEALRLSQIWSATISIKNRARRRTRVLTAGLPPAIAERTICHALDDRSRRLLLAIDCKPPQDQDVERRREQREVQPIERRGRGEPCADEQDSANDERGDRYFVRNARRDCRRGKRDARDGERGDEKPS